MRQKNHRIFLTEPVLNCRGKVQKSVFLDDGEFAILRSRAALLGTSARALMTIKVHQSNVKQLRWKILGEMSTGRNKNSKA